MPAIRRAALAVVAVALHAPSGPATASEPATGNAAWTRLYGTPEDDYALAVAGDQGGELVIAGSTRGTLDDGYHGNLDAYTLRLVDPSNR